MTFTRTLVVFCICAAASGKWQIGVQGLPAGGSQFEPLYSNDAPYTSDVHTVTVNQQENSNGSFKKLLEQRLPPTIDDDNSLSQFASSRTGTGVGGGLISKTTPSHNTFSHSTPFNLALSNTAKRQIVSSGPYGADYLTSLTAATPAAPTVATSKQTEPPKHWSAIENYYNKIKQDTLRKQFDDRLLSPEQQIILGSFIQDGPREHDLKLYRLQRPQPAYGALDQQPPAYGAGQSSNRAPYLPPVASVLPSFSANPGQLSPTKSLSPATNNWPAQPTPYSFNLTTGGQQRYLFDLDPIKQRPVIIEQTLEPAMPIMRKVIELPGGSNYDGSTPAGRRAYQIELGDQLVNDLLKARLKSQQDTFGAYYDQQRSLQQLQEEAYCGPRNYVNYKLGGPPSLRAPIKVSGGMLSEDNLKELLQSQTSVPIPLTVGEYPSHMGLYNGSTVADDSFICGATWVNERFALTLASCISNNFSTQSNGMLTVRAGEWNVGRQSDNKTLLDGDKLAASMATRQVRRVHLFHGYEASSGEHNLALIEWEQPINFLEAPYICPACQPQLRNSLQTSACWTPVRTVSYSEYFDADGEGETKLKRNVGMVEVPVKLYANHESECKSRTGLEYFNFQHPNYICSGDVKKAQWRAKLNQTDHFGSGIYCNEGGVLTLVSIVHPIRLTNSSAYGYLDLSYYKPWIRKVISGMAY